MESNHLPLGYEPNELPMLYPAITWWRMRESNSHEDLAKVPGSHYINPPNSCHCHFHHRSPATELLPCPHIFLFRGVVTHLSDFSSLPYPGIWGRSYAPDSCGAVYPLLVTVKSKPGYSGASQWVKYGSEYNLRAYSPPFFVKLYSNK